MASQVCPARFATSSTGSVPPPSVRPLASPASRPPRWPSSMSIWVSAVFRDLLRDRLRGIAELTDEQAAALESHYNLLVLWNRTLNLTTIRDLPEVIERHYGESLFVAARLPADEDQRADGKGREDGAQGDRGSEIAHEGGGENAFAEIGAIESELQHDGVHDSD